MPARRTAQGATTTFGANLRRLRLDAGLTQDDLRKRLRIKRTTPISLWERSTTVPEPATITRLAAALGVTPAALLDNVLTPYDILRGYTVVPSLDEVLAIVTLDEQDQRWLDIGRLAGDALRAAHYAMLAEVVRERADQGRPGAADGRFRAARARLDGARAPVTR